MCANCQTKRRRSHDERRYSQGIFEGKRLVPSDDEMEMDYRVYYRTFSGRMTKKRYQLIRRICRFYSRSFRYSCGHDWDCCGCLCGHSMTFTYKHNQVKIRISYSYNY